MMSLERDMKLAREVADMFKSSQHTHVAAEVEPMTAGVPAALNLLGDNLGQLLHELDELREKLRPVLAERPKLGHSNDDTAVSRGQSELSERLYNIEEMVQMARQRVNTLMIEIDL